MKIRHGSISIYLSLFCLIPYCIGIGLKLVQPDFKSFFHRDGDGGNLYTLNGLDSVAIAQKQANEIFAENKEGRDSYVTSDEAINGFIQKNPGATDVEVNFFRVISSKSENAGYITLDELIMYIVETYERFPSVKAFKENKQEVGNKNKLGRTNLEIKSQNMANKIFSFAKSDTKDFVTSDEAIKGFKSEEKTATRNMIKDFTERVIESEFGKGHQVTYQELTSHLLKTYTKDFNFKRKLKDYLKKENIEDSKVVETTSLLSKEFYGSDSNEDESLSLVSIEDAIKEFEKKFPNCSPEDFEEFKRMLDEDKKDGKISRDELNGFQLHVPNETPLAKSGGLEKEEISIIEESSRIESNLNERDLNPKDAAVAEENRLEITENKKKQNMAALEKMVSLSVDKGVHVQDLNIITESQLKKKSKEEEVDRAQLINQETSNQGKSQSTEEDEILKYQEKMKRQIANDLAKEDLKLQKLENEARDLTLKIMSNDLDKKGYLTPAEVKEAYLKIKPNTSEKLLKSFKSLFDIVTESELEDFLVNLLKREIKRNEKKSNSKQSDSELELYHQALNFTSFSELSHQNISSSAIINRKKSVLLSKSRKLKRNSTTRLKRFKLNSTNVSNTSIISKRNYNVKDEKVVIYDEDEDFDDSAEIGSDGDQFEKAEENLLDAAGIQASESAKAFYNELQLSKQDLISYSEALSRLLKAEPTLSQRDLKAFQNDLVKNSDFNGRINFNQLKSYLIKIYVRDLNEESKETELIEREEDSKENHELKKDEIPVFSRELVENIFIEVSKKNNATRNEEEDISEVFEEKNITLKNSTETKSTSSDVYISHSDALGALMKLDDQVSGKQLKDFLILSLEDGNYKNVKITKKSLEAFLIQVINEEKENKEEVELEYNGYDDL